jgi:FtsH-binding integral membrane protein
MKTRLARSSLYNRFMSGSSSGGSSSGSGCGSGLFGGGSAKSKGVEFLKLLNQKKSFLILVFANLIAQLGITYYVMMNYATSGAANSAAANSATDKSKQPTGQFYLLFFLQIIIIFVLAFVPMPAWLKFIIFSVFSASFGISLSYVKNMVSPGLIQTALAGTMGIFAAMFLLGLLLIMFGIQLGLGFGLFLFFSLLLLIIIQVVTMFAGGESYPTKAFALVSLILFSLFIIYDTNTILQREYYGDFITASMDYYLDILNVFLDLVSFGDGNN